MRFSLVTLVIVALLAAAGGFVAGWQWRRHSHPTAAEQFDEASKSLRKGLFGE
jgi:DNA-binding transcriptional regulator of glucitol operon